MPAQKYRKFIKKIYLCIHFVIKKNILNNIKNQSNMKKILSLTLLLFAGLFAAQAQTYLLNEGFENGFPSTWSNLDNDGDGFSWEVLTEEDAFTAHSGEACITSASYDNEEMEELEPDNYLVTPAITIPATLTASNMPLLCWWAAAQDPDFPEDYYEIRISTNGNAASDFTGNAVYAEILSTDEWTQHTVNLSEYIGQTIYIAFIHTNCSDEFIMKLDDISVFYFENPSIVATPNTLDMGTVAINTNSASQQIHVISALLDGNITVSCEAPFTVSINNNTFSASQSLTSNTTAVLFVRYEPTEEGSHEGVINLTSGNVTTPITISGTAVNCDNAMQLPFYEDFESDITPCWTLRDGDNDGMNWMWMNDGYGHESDGYYLSFSYDEEEWEDIMPQDWLITPRIAIPATGAHISWWIAGYVEDFPDNSYYVLVADEPTFANPTNLYNETVHSGTFEQRVANLTGFEGQEIYIAFVHTTNTNEIETSYGLVIDDILIEEGVGIEEHTASATVSVYPNPASQMLNIKAEGFDNCVMMNALGQTVISEPIVNGELHLNIAHLSNGVYFVKCIGDGAVETVKIIKK